MFYTVVCSWSFYYFWLALTGGLSGLTPEETRAIFGGLLASPWLMTFLMAICVFGSFYLCALGLKKGVEQSVKIMMGGLGILLLILAVRAVTLPGAGEGLVFLFKPDFGRMIEVGLWKSIHAALGQAFFTLSLGIGCMAIFASYTNRERSLTGESVNIAILDSVVALICGVIIFAACFAYKQNVAGGPGLLFIVMPNIFNDMPIGRFWATLFFLFVAFASVTTVIAVFENIIAFAMDNLGWTRRKAAWVNSFIIFFGSLPCILGFNVLKGVVQPLGPGTDILAFLGFLVSDNFLPIGGLIYALFCSWRYGWGWDNFMAEANQGQGMKFPRALRFYCTYILPAIMVIIIVQGYINRFG